MMLIAVTAASLVWPGFRRSSRFISDEFDGGLRMRDREARERLTRRLWPDATVASTRLLKGAQ
jgi:hypothetical protein